MTAYTPPPFPISTMSRANADAFLAAHPECWAEPRKVGFAIFCSYPVHSAEWNATVKAEQEFSLALAIKAMHAMSAK